MNAIKINYTKSSILGSAERRFHVSSRRFFMLTPCLWGLKVLPGRQNTCRWGLIHRRQISDPTRTTYLVRYGAGSGAEVRSERDPALCWPMTSGYLELLWGLAEVSCCVSASGGCWGCWAEALWKVDCWHQSHPGLLARAEWSPKARGHLQTEPQWVRIDIWFPNRHFNDARTIDLFEQCPLESGSGPGEGFF